MALSTGGKQNPPPRTTTNGGKQNEIQLAGNERQRVHLL